MPYGGACLGTPVLFMNNELVGNIMGVALVHSFNQARSVNLRVARCARLPV